MQCPKCGSGVSDERTECPICFAPLAADERLAGPAIMRAPTAPKAFDDMDEPVAGIPGIDNLPKPETAAPNYLSGNVGVGGAPAASGEMRVSLTGEVMEVTAPSRPTTSSAGIAPVTGMRSNSPAMPGPVRSSYSRPTSRAEAP